MLQYCYGFAKKYGLEDDRYLREAYRVESKFLQNAQVSEPDINHDLYHVANIKWYRDKILTTQEKVKTVLEEIDGQIWLIMCHDLSCQCICLQVYC